MIEGYLLGCPMWGNRAWVGRFYTTDAGPRDYLGQYASVFNAVEGNMSFYGDPSASTVKRWQESTPESFRFCFKFPRRVSHELQLQGAEAADEARRFLDCIAPLGARLGPIFLLLPPSFGPSRLPRLATFLAQLPDQLRYAVEMRHQGFSGDSDASRRLNQLLSSCGVDRVLMDTRPQDGEPPDPITPVATGRHPFVRFVGRQDPIASDPWLMQWVEAVARWIAGGLEPCIFMHSPDDLYSPVLARRFHQLLAERRPDVGEIEPWPAAAAAAADKQLSLF